jgi:hypothetical protein
MNAFANVVRFVIAAVVIVVVSDLSKRFPRYGALILSLPIVSILAFAMSWQQHRDFNAISQLAKETAILVLLGLPFFLPFAFGPKLGLGFWTAMASGVLLASVSVGLWLTFGPKF